eukprot:9183870-Pyramimonas_sp.AAC.1
MNTWVNNQGLDWTDDMKERACFNVRCLLSQLLNHKSNSWSVPSSWQQKYSVLWDKLSGQPQASPTRVAQHASGAASSDVEVTGEGDNKANTEVVDVSECESSSSIVDKSALFSSADPALDSILKAGGTAPEAKISSTQPSVDTTGRAE